METKKDHYRTCYTRRVLLLNNCIIARVIVEVVHQRYSAELIDVFMNIKTDNYSLLHATAMITYHINIIIK